MVVDRVGEHGATPGNFSGDQLGAALAAFADRRMHPVRAMIAILDEQPPVWHDEYSTLNWFDAALGVV